MRTIISKINKLWVFLVLVGGALVSLFIVVWVIVDLRTVEASEIQPVEYSHRLHIQNGISCIYCHTEAMRSTIAGIPSVEKCMGCHAHIVTEGDAISGMVGYWERGEPIPWKQVNKQPDFVYFGHQSHMGAGINCETCHGNLAEMDYAEASTRMDMGWCLNCHKQQESEKLARLVDCLTCHK